MGKKTKHKSSLEEVKGIKQPESIQKIKLNRSKLPSTKAFVENILKGDITYLSRAITLVESTNTKHQKRASEILSASLPYANNSIRIGITGVPGVGKSTFIEVFGKHLTSLGKKVAVLAVDPSSSINSGSILGDKTRMPSLVKDENAFIRPSPSGESLGGVAQKTREAIILCEAAGYDTIIIETVGVGQSEIAVHSMVDFFLLLKLAGAGDELQGIKRGIIEMADAIVINKADGDNIKRANLAKIEFTRALHLYPLKESIWQPKVTTCSAIENTEIDSVWEIIEAYINLTKKNSYFEKQRNEQNKFWVLETINEKLKNQFYTNPIVKKELINVLNKVQQHELSSFEAAKKVLDVYHKK
ncbi:MAG: methylmalonyl Co-A mutase-associated GTPase MeaB [Flavobacteriaceae bacterium]|nr:methylmalonyl Co-A mutase-associated GTPase MeaB [Flavobacteriaceae bacterium]